MALLFRHGFRTMGPWKTRPVPPESGHITPAEDCARISASGVLRLGIRQNPLRSGHIWVPPEVFTVTYGSVEARMRFYGPLGAHSCFWLQAVPPYATPEHHEVDIAEHFGNPMVVHNNVHWVEGVKMQEHHGNRVLARDWHVYGVEIKPGGYRFYIDDKFVYATDVIAPAVEKTLILSFLSDDWERPNLDSDLTKYRTAVDFVRVFQ